MVLPDSHRVLRALWYSGSALIKLSFRLQAFHLLWLGLPAPSANFASLNARPTTPMALLPLVWALPGSLAATTGITVLFSFPVGTKMFQFPTFAPYHYEFMAWFSLRRGFTHSEIPGSKPTWRLTEAYRSLSRPSSLLDT